MLEDFVRVVRRHLDSPDEVSEALLRSCLDEVEAFVAAERVHAERLLDRIALASV